MLKLKVGDKVKVRVGKDKGREGKIEIEFYSNDDLDRLIARLQQTKI